MTVVKFGYKLQIQTPHRGVYESMSQAPTEKHKKDLVKRLHYAEGHVRAIAGMVERDAYCMDIVNQNHAVIEALRKVNQMILEGYLGECAWDAVASSDVKKRKKAVMELVNLYSKK